VPGIPRDRRSPPAGVDGGDRYGIGGVSAGGAFPGDEVADVALFQGEAECRGVAVAGIGRDDRRPVSPLGEFVEHLDRHLPFRAVVLACGDLARLPPRLHRGGGLGAVGGLIVPALGHEQPPVQRRRRLVGDRVDADRHLAVPDLAHRPEYCRATHADAVPSLAWPVSSITHACGPITPIDRRTNAFGAGSTSHGDEVMNCCNR